MRKKQSKETLPSVTLLNKTIPDLSAIILSYRHLYKKPPTMQEIKEIQKIWVATENHT